MTATHSPHTHRTRVGRATAHRAAPNLSAQVTAQRPPTVPTSTPHATPTWRALHWDPGWAVLGVAAAFLVAVVVAVLLLSAGGGVDLPTDPIRVPTSQPAGY
jgi:hypothetical protein